MYRLNYYIFLHVGAALLSYRSYGCCGHFTKKLLHTVSSVFFFLQQPQS